MASCNGLPFLLNMIHIYRSAFSKYLLTVKYAKAQENQRFSMVTKLKLCALKTVLLKIFLAPLRILLLINILKMHKGYI